MNAEGHYFFSPFKREVQMKRKLEHQELDVLYILNVSRDIFNFIKPSWSDIVDAVNWPKET